MGKENPNDAVSYRKFSYSQENLDESQKHWGIPQNRRVACPREKDSQMAPNPRSDYLWVKVYSTYEMVLWEVNATPKGDGQYKPR